MKRRRARILAPIIVVLLLAAGVAAASGLADQATPTVTPSSGVVREVIDGGMPSAAPGEVLQLVRFTIAPGTKLPVHTHPGMQVAWLESGTLHYTVVRGAAQITRARRPWHPRPGRDPDLRSRDRFPRRRPLGRAAGDGPLRAKHRDGAGGHPGRLAAGRQPAAGAGRPDRDAIGGLGAGGSMLGAGSGTRGWVGPCAVL